MAKKDTALVPEIAQTIQVEVDGELHAIDLEDIGHKVKIDPNHLEDEMRRQPEFQYWIGMLAGNAKLNAEAAEQQFKIWFSAKQKEVREQLEEENSKVAATTVESAARSDPDYAEEMDKQLYAQRVHTLMDVAYRAVLARQYMLTAIGGLHEASGGG